MKKGLYLFLILTAGLTLNGQAQSRYVLSDSSAISAAIGYIRPADLIKKDLRWNRASSDFFTYWIDSGLYGFYGPQPKILVDGLPVDANFFGWQNLNMLPVNGIKKVEYSFDPQLFESTIAPAGFINYKTAPVDTGLTANASFYVGNETGDPGPYNYDSTKVTPNIDRWGPDGAISLAYCKNNWYTKGLFAFHNNHPTDLALNSRLHFTASLLGTNRPYVNHTIYEATRSGLLETGYQANTWQIKARTAYGINKDYLFLQPFGREIPAKSRYRQVAFWGDYQTGDWKFTGRYIGHQKRIDKRIELHSYIFDWDQRRHTLGFNVSYNPGKWRIQPGLTYQHLKTLAPGLDAITDDLTTLSLAATIITGQNDSLKMHGNIDFEGAEIGKTLGLSLHQSITAGWSLSPSVSYTEVLPIRQNSFSYWVNRGYTFADSLGISYGPSATVKKNRLAIFKLENQLTIAPRLSLIISPQLISHQALNIPFQPVKEYEFVTDTKPGTFTITDARGSRFELFSQLRYAIPGKLQQSLAVDIQRTASGSSRYKNYFDQIPRTKIEYTVDVYPTRSLILSLNALYRSSTNWNEFSAIEGNRYRLPNGIPIRQVTGTFHTRTPAFTNISLNVQKWFWGRHLNTQFSVRNLLNEEVRMHPLGAELATKFDIRISLNF